MNFKITLILVLISLALIVANVDFGVDVNPDKQNTSKKTGLNIIKPVQLEQQSEDILIAKEKIKLVSDFTKSNRTLQQRKTFDNERFSKEGQAYTTLGELMLKNQKKVSTQNYSVELFKQITQAKYNLKIAKEMAYLSKDLFIETDDGKKIDEKVYQKIKELRNDLIVELKKQNNK